MSATVHFHDTLGLSPGQLVAASRVAKGQDAFILDLFREAGRPMTPRGVHEQCQRAGKQYELTSVRRAITNLTEAGALVKLGLVDGPKGKPQHLWSLPAGQGELFARGRV